MRLEKNVFHLVGMRSENFLKMWLGWWLKSLHNRWFFKTLLKVLGLWASCGWSHQRHQNEKGKPSSVFAFYLETQFTKI